MAANRYAEMVRWMAWPRIKNSRSSAQPGTHPHDGVQATVTPAPDAEPQPGTGHNTGVGGTRHAVADGPGSHGPGSGNPVDDRSVTSRRRRPIKYAHSPSDRPAAPGAPVDRAEGSISPSASPNSALADEATSSTESSGSEFSDPVLSGTVLSGTVLSGTVLSGTVLPGPGPIDEEPEDYDTTAGLVYEAPRPAYSEPLADEPVVEPVVEPARPVSNEGLGIFGDVKTTEVPDEDVPTRDFESRTGSKPTRVIPIGASWNQSISSPPVASDEAEERKPNPFGRRVREIWAGQPADDDTPRVLVRDLPPDVQMRLYRIRATIMLVVGVAFFILTRNWAIALTLAILAGIVDTIYRSRNAAMYRNGATFPGARKATSKQLRKMRREGYFSLDARPIPNSREFIDHLVVGPTGVYAIDSEKWNPKLPIRTWNGKKLYHGPESQKDRLEHAVWEASQASEILSGALGTEVKVQPALAIYGPKIPWDIATIRNVDVFTGPALRKYLKRRSRMKEGVVRLTGEEVRTIYETAARMLPDVAHSHAPVG
jgi:nuclease-like protein